MDQRACFIHGLSYDNDLVVKTDEIDVVWKGFCKFMGRHTGPVQRGVLVAWNGQ